MEKFRGPEEIGIEDFGGCMIYEDQAWASGEDEKFSFTEYLEMEDW